MLKRITPLITNDLLLQPIAVLDLSVRANNTLKRARVKTIRDILAIGEDEFIKLPQVGKSQVHDIFNAVAKLLHISREELFILKQSQKFSDTDLIALSDSPPQPIKSEKYTIPQQIRDQSVWLLIENIHLFNILNKSGIFTINDYVRAYEGNILKGIPELKMRSTANAEVLLERLMASSSNFQGKLTPDLIHKIICGDRPYIVDIQLHSQAPINLIKIIVPFVKSILSPSDENRLFQIISALYKLDSHENYTLEDVGSVYGISRERVRQNKGNALRKIRKALSGMTQLPTHVIPIELIKEVETVKQELNALDPNLITEDQVIEFFNTRYKMMISIQEISTLRFLLVIFGYTQFVTPVLPWALAPTWRLNTQLDAGKIGETMRVILSILREDVNAIPIFQLKVKVNRKSKIGPEYIEYAMRLLAHDIEQVDSNSYQLKFTKLSSVADQAYRVLNMFGDPKHYRDLVKEINHILIKSGEEANVNARTLVNQLAVDHRFKSIGSSGIWALDEWKDVVAASTIELIESFFHLLKRAATVAEIHEYVVAKRPKVAKNSIYTYLTSREQFVRVSENEFELKVWGSKPYIPKTKTPINKIIFDASLNIFKNKRIQVLPLRELVLAIAEKTELSEDVIYRELPKFQSIVTEIDPEKGNRKLARIISDETKLALDKQKLEKISEAKNERTTLIQLVFAEVDDYLRKQPQMRAPLAQILSHLVARIKCNKQTAYNYISKMSSLSKEKVNGITYYCILQAQGSAPFEFTQINRIKATELKSQINRAISLLKIETVDLGLFELGKLLEKRLEEYLKTARSKNVFPVSSDDLSRLVSMIECVAKNGIIKNKHELTYLREERNRRAHGEIPTVAEREDLMRKSEFLANLYIDYIVLFEEKYQQII